MPHRGGTGDSGGKTQFDRLLTLLADSERRRLLRILHRQGSVSVEAAVGKLRAETGDPPDEATLRGRLEDDHLPALAAADLVTVDGEEISLSGLPPTVATILDLEDADGPDEPGGDKQVREEGETVHRGQQGQTLSTLVNNLPGVAYQCRNERGRPMSFVSEGCRELTGHDPGDIETEAVRWGEDIAHPEDRDEVWTEIQDALDRREQFDAAYRIRRADGTVRWVRDVGRGIFDDGEAIAIEGFVADVTDQRRRERRLEAAFDGTFQFMGLLDPDGTVIEVNAAALEFGDLDREEVVGLPAWETPWWSVDEQTQAGLRRAVDRAADGEFVRYEVTIGGADRDATIDFSLRPFEPENGTDTLLIAEGRDITERVRREEQLETLTELSNDLIQAETMQAACEIGVDGAAETLGVDHASIGLFDDDAGDLGAVARNDASAELADARSMIETGTGDPWQAFIEQDEIVYDDIGADSPFDPERTGLESVLVLPLGNHGVLVAGTTDGEPFGETDVDVARMLGGYVEASLDRAVREKRLKERTQTLEEKNERLSRLNALNQVVRDLLESVIDASTRDGILRTACESLAAVGPYRFAWAGRRDPVTDEVQPVGRVGVEDGYLDAVLGDDAAEPAARALRDDEVIVVNQIRSDPPFEPWQRAALDRGYHSAIAIPLVYDDACYGVLAAYATERDQFDDLEQSLLSELGDAIGYAIAATQRKRALIGERDIELEIELSNPDAPLPRIAGDTGAELVTEDVIQSADGEISVFVTVRGGSPDAVKEASEHEPDLADISVVGDRADGTRYEVTLIDESLLSAVLEHGGVPEELTAESGDTTLVVTLPGSRNVREFVDVIEEQFPSASLVAHRQAEQDHRTTSALRQELEERLTERNLEVARKAYYGGFFEQPRENSGREIAESLDITQPTFNRHIRTVQGTLFELLLEQTVR